MEWLRYGWGVFEKNPGVWVGLMALFLVLIIATAMVPLVGGLAAHLLLPLLIAGMLTAVRKAEMDEEFRIGNLFLGFKEETSGLVLLGVLYMAAEKQRIQAALPHNARIIALDERGDNLTTLQLAQRLEQWMQDGRDVAFLIGGADGLDPALKSQADGMLRLSSLTLPHAFARLMLCEQIYRAWSVIHNHPYHRE